MESVDGSNEDELRVGGTCKVIGGGRRLRNDDNEMVMVMVMVMVIGSI